MRSNGQAFKPGGQEPVATPLCGVVALAVVAGRVAALFRVQRWVLSVGRWTLSVER